MLHQPVVVGTAKSVLNSVRGTAVDGPSWLDTSRKIQDGPQGANGRSPSYHKGQIPREMEIHKTPIR